MSVATAAPPYAASLLSVLAARVASLQSPVARPVAPDAPLALPRALEPWASALQLFPEDLALGLGDAVRRVARLLGPLRLDADARSGVPDGYRGITRRGPLERLLLSEWALLLEVPDEFVRRAAMGEQLFTALAHQQPGGTRRSVALFDAGPRSLGRPRIAQLALLIALAERARAAGVRFAWGLLQDDRRSQIAELNEASIRRLLDGRSAYEASAVDAAEWAIALGEARAADDLWLVGPRGLETTVALGRGTQLVVEDATDPAQRAVEVTLVRPRAAPRAVVLDMPEEPLCTRLIREPFARRVRAVRRAGAEPLGPATALWFEPSGRRLLRRHARNHGVSALHIPRSPRESTGLPLVRVPEPGEELLGATVANNRLFTVETSAGGLVVSRLGGHGGVGSRWDLTVPTDALAPLFTAGVSTVLVEAAGRELTRVHLLDRQGGLWMGEPGGTLVPRDADVSTLLQVERAVYHSSRARGATQVLRLRGTDTQLISAAPTNGRGELILCAAAVTVPGTGVAIRASAALWTVLGTPAAVALEAPPHEDVVGLAFREGEFGLLHLSPDRSTLSWTSRNTTRVLHRPAKGILAVAINPRYPSVACLDRGSGLQVVGTDGVVRYEREVD